MLWKIDEKALTGLEVDRCRKELLAHGAGVAARLADLLAGKDVDLADLPFGGPGDDANVEDRLRQMAASIQSALDRIAAGSFGRCLDCAEPLARAVLSRSPWTARCSDCEQELRRHGPPRA